MTDKASKTARMMQITYHDGEQWAPTDFDGFTFVEDHEIGPVQQWLTELFGLDVWLQPIKGGGKFTQINRMWCDKLHAFVLLFERVEEPNNTQSTTH